MSQSILPNCATFAVMLQVSPEGLREVDVVWGLNDPRLSDTNALYEQHDGLVH